MSRCFQVNSQDNVATMLVDANPGPVTVVGKEGMIIRLRKEVKLGHKVALADIEPGAAVIKYGVRIGHATKEIKRGDWVHLHNLASDIDERSSTFDCETGVPPGTKYL
jgi:hypothetical protein